MFGREYANIFVSDVLGVADEITGYQRPGSEADPKDPLVDHVSKYFGYQRLELKDGSFAEDLIFKFINENGEVIDEAKSVDYKEASNEERLARMIHKCALAGQLDGYGFELTLGKLKCDERLANKLINRALTLSLLATSIMPLPLVRVHQISSFGASEVANNITKNLKPDVQVSYRDVQAGDQLMPDDNVSVPPDPNGNAVVLNVPFVDDPSAVSLPRTINFKVFQDGAENQPTISLSCQSGTPDNGPFRSANDINHIIGGGGYEITMEAGRRLCENGDTILEIENSAGSTSQNRYFVDFSYTPGNSSDGSGISFGAQTSSLESEIPLGDREVLVFSGEGKDGARIGLKFKFDNVVPFGNNAELITGTVSIQLPGASEPITSPLKYNPDTNTLSTQSDSFVFDNTTESLQTALVNFFLEGFSPIQGRVSVMTPITTSQSDPRFDLVFLGPSDFSTDGNPDLQKALINSVKLWNKAENQAQKPLIMVGQYGNSEGIDSVNLSKNKEAQEIDSIVNALEGMGIHDISILFLSHGEDGGANTGALLSIGGNAEFYSRDDLADLVNRHPRMRFTVYSMICKGSGLIPPDIPENLRMLSQTSGPTGLNTPLKPSYELPGGISGFYDYHTQKLTAKEALDSMQNDTNYYTLMGLGALRYENSPRLFGKVDLGKKQNQDPINPGVYRINLPIVNNAGLGRNQGIRTLYMPAVLAGKATANPRLSNGGR